MHSQNKNNNTHAAQVQRARGAAGQGAAGVAATATARCARDECPFRALLLAWSQQKRQRTEVIGAGRRGVVAVGSAGKLRPPRSPEASAAPTGPNCMPAIAIESVDSVPQLILFGTGCWELDAGAATALIFPRGVGSLMQRM